MHRVKAPTLVVSGDDDPLVPLVNARLLTALIPDARLHVVRGGGHLILFDTADEVGAVIRTFLGRVTPGPSPRAGRVRPLGVVVRYVARQREGDAWSTSAVAATRATRRSRTPSPLNFERGRRRRRLLRGGACGGELVVDLWGGTLDVEAHHAVGGGHDHQRVLDHQDDELPVAAGAGQPGPARRRRPRLPLLARVRAGRQGGRARAPPALPHRRAARLGASALDGTDLYDWDKVTGLLAEQAPWWEPGCEVGLPRHHPGLPGRRGRAPGRRAAPWARFFAEEIAEPLGADFHIGTRPERRRPGRPGHPAAAAARRHRRGRRRGRRRRSPTAAPTRALAAEESWTIPWRRAEIPAAGGHGNARSVALAQSAVSPAATADGVELLSPRRCDAHLRRAGRRRATSCSASACTFGVGYGLNSPRAPIGPNPRVCYWGGWGGSLVVNDVDAGFTMAYVMNRMGEGTVGDDRAHTILRGVYDSLDN